MFTLGTGIMRLVNIGLMVLVAVGLMYAAWSAIKGRWVEQGRQEVITEVEKRNRELTEHVITVNENIVRRVITETRTIDRRSREIEDIVNEQPSEPLSNVTRARLERVREQQRHIREANS
jgi:hypothetical protein